MKHQQQTLSQNINGSKVGKGQSGESPQPQIRVRMEQYKQKTSNDLAKFEERLIKQ